MQTQTLNPFHQIEQRFDDLEQLIKGLHNVVKNQSPELDPHERLTRSEIKKEYKVSLGTIHNAMKASNLPYSKVGRKTLFKRVDVENWINRKGAKNG